MRNGSPAHSLELHKFATGKAAHPTFDLTDLLITDLKLPDRVYATELETLGARWCWEVWMKYSMMGAKGGRGEGEGF